MTTKVKDIKLNVVYSSIFISYEITPTTWPTTFVHSKDVRICSHFDLLTKAWRQLPSLRKITLCRLYVKIMIDKLNSFFYDASIAVMLDQDNIVLFNYWY